MDPQIVRDAPGSCPICGMALEPMSPTDADARNPELDDMTRRFWVSLAITLPLFGLVMAAHVRPDWIDALLPGRRGIWLQLALATPVVLWGGLPFFQRGWTSLVTRHLNMFTLIALGTGVAYGYSVVAALVPAIFPVSFRGMDGAVAVYFEAAAVITTLVLLGQLLELQARARASGAVRAAARPGTEDRPRATRRRQRGGHPARAGSCRASGCACAPAKRCRSTAFCSTATARSTNR